MEDIFMVELIITGSFTILGTILGIIIAEWNRRGKIFVSSNNLNLNYMISDGYGGYSITDNAEKSEYLTCLVNIQLYNSADFNKVARDIKMEFEINGEKIIKNIFESKKVLSYITLKPKEYIEKNITINIFSSDKITNYKYIKKESHIYISYKDEKGNSKRVKLQ